MIARQMNTERMSEFLAQVSAAHPDEYIIMVVDGASSHVAKDLVVPQNMRLLRLPPYAPELNPARVKLVVASFMLPTAVYRRTANAS